MTENMPGGRAIKPGDVLTSAEGKTVEILNTDAEGRLVLGDALWYARQLGATHLVDVATLTGAVRRRAGQDDERAVRHAATRGWTQVLDASERAGDRSWPMPIFDDYKELLKSEIADFTNTGGRAGGAITGALFIKEFAGELPWVHIDIAGTAWAEEAKPYQPKGRDRRRRAHAGRARAGRADVERPCRTPRPCTMLWLQQNPIVVEVAKQPPPTPRSPASTPSSASSRWRACSCWRPPSASVLVAGAIVIYKKWRGDDESKASHTQLRI